MHERMTEGSSRSPYGVVSLSRAASRDKAGLLPVLPSHVTAVTCCRLAGHAAALPLCRKSGSALARVLNFALTIARRRGRLLRWKTFDSLARQ